MINGWTRIEPRAKKRKGYYLRTCKRCNETYKATGRYSVICNDCKKNISKLCLRCKKKFRTNNGKKRLCQRCDSTLKKGRH